MQVFEYYFNPPEQSKVATGKAKLIFDSFCFEPENIYEKRVGSLYTLGALKSSLPQNTHLLEKLTRVIKEKYYSPTAKSPEKSLKDSLKRANEFLEDLTKGGDVSWLGNLNFAALSIKNFELNFSKVGEIKIFLLRGNKLVDIDKKVNVEDIEPYPLKVFLNVVSGKLTEDDVILVLSKDIFDFFQKEDLLNEIVKVSPFEEKKFREILNSKEEKFKELSGICLLIILSPEKLAAQKRAIMAQPKEEKKFSFEETFSLLISFLKKPKIPQIRIPQIKIPQIKIPFLKAHLPSALKPKIPQLKTSSFLKTLKIKTKDFFEKKKVILILGLIFLLIVGFLIFQKETERQIREKEEILFEIEEKKNMAESLLILKSPQPNKEANLLLKESWEALFPLTEMSSSLPQNLKEKVFILEKEILENLYQLNNIVEIEDPEVIFLLEEEDFLAEKIIFDGKNFYFFSSFSPGLLKIAPNKEGQLLETEKGFELGLSFNAKEEILLFLKPNEIKSLRKGVLGKSFLLEAPYSDEFDFISFAQFRSNLYFLDKKTGEIIQYPFFSGFRWGFPQLWLNPQTEKVVGAKSIAVDGSIWILKENSVKRYYQGVFQENLSLDLFPQPKNFSKIFTSPLLSYLYILEPAEKRIIILDKTGRIIKQFQSEKFDNLLDFTLSENGKTIWLLNDLKVYQIQF